MVNAIVMSVWLFGPLLATGELPDCGQGASPDSAETPCQVQEPSPNLLWRYPVPPPSLDDLSPQAADQTTDSDEVRREIAAARRLSEKIIDGYSRQIDQCRFDNNTLHFDDREQVRLIGNDQPCQNRYWHLISQERAALKRRITEIRGGREDNSLHPVPLNP